MIVNINQECNNLNYISDLNSPYTYQQTILVKQNSRVTTLKIILLILFLTVVHQYGFAQKTKTNPKGTYREIREFYKELNESEIATILMQHPTKKACDELIDTALRKQCRDNVTVVVIAALVAEKTILRCDTE